MAKNKKKNFLGKSSSDRPTASITFPSKTEICKTCTCKPDEWCEVQSKLAKYCKK